MKHSMFQPLSRFANAGMGLSTDTQTLYPHSMRHLPDSIVGTTLPVLPTLENRYL